jgi:hypothetical protein
VNYENYHEIEAGERIERDLRARRWRDPGAAVLPTLREKLVGVVEEILAAVRLIGTGALAVIGGALTLVLWLVGVGLVCAPWALAWHVARWEGIILGAPLLAIISVVIADGIQQEGVEFEREARR